MQTASLQLDLLVQVGRAHEAVKRGLERVALAFPDGKPGSLAAQLTAAIGAQLLASHDVTGLTLSN